MQPTVWTFFYGSFINLDVLAHVELRPDRVETARVHGFDITIRPLANLVRSERDIAYGILATATHDELERLYAHAEHDLGGRYLPEAILAETRAGTWRPALCYIAPQLADTPASEDYIDRLSVPARLHGFPDWYVQRIESFRSGTTSAGA